MFIRKTDKNSSYRLPSWQYTKFLNIHFVYSAHCIINNIRNNNFLRRNKNSNMSAARNINYLQVLCHVCVCVCGTNV